MLPAIVRKMLPLDVWGVIAGYVVEPVCKLSPEFEWSLGLLRNPRAGALIRGFLEKTEMTQEMAVELVNNPNPEFLSYIDLARFPVVRDLCRHQSKEAMAMLARVPASEWQWDMLSGNPFAIELLERNLDKVMWRDAAENSAAYELIKKAWTEKEMSCWDSFYILRGVHSKKLFQEIPTRFSESAVFNATGLFYEREVLFEEGVPMVELCAKPDRLHLLQEIPTEKWSLEGLIENPSPDAVHYIAAWLEREMATADLDEVGWLLSQCRHPEVIEFLVEDPELAARADAKQLSGNPAAIDALLENRAWVNWDTLANNSNSRAIEVVRKYADSFRASQSSRAFYKREEMLVVDGKETEKVKKFYLG